MSTLPNPDVSLAIQLKDHTDQMLAFNLVGYTSARSELIERIKARDAAVTIYLTSISILFAAYVAANLKELPFELGIQLVFAIVGVLGLATSQAVSNHQIKIATIGYFLDKELVHSLRKLPSRIRALDWESSDTNKHTSRLPRRLQYLYYYIIFLSPQVLAVLFSADASYAGSTPEHSLRHGLFCVFHACCILGTVFVLHIANRERQRYNSMRKHT